MPNKWSFVWRNDMLRSEKKRYITYINSTIIDLTRVASGVYDGASFDSTSFNRGWITIWYAE